MKKLSVIMICSVIVFAAALFAPVQASADQPCVTNVDAVYGGAGSCLLSWTNNSGGADLFITTSGTLGTTWATHYTNYKMPASPWYISMFGYMDTDIIITISTNAPYRASVSVRFVRNEQYPEGGCFPVN